MAPLADLPPAVNVHALHDHHQGTWRTYVVAEGDDLKTIARRHGTTIAVLAAQNGLEDPDVLLAGQHLQVPAGGARGAGAPGGSDESSHISTTTGSKVATRTLMAYVVQPGDTLNRIAANHGTSLAAILKANRIADPDVVNVGDIVRVPTRASVADAPASDQTSRPARATSRSAGSATTTAHSGASQQTPLSLEDRTFLGNVYSESTVRQAASTRQYLSTQAVPTASQTRAMIVETANRYGVPPRLALAIGLQESGWNQRAVSIAGAIGVMQVMPGTGTFASEMAGRPLNLHIAQDNITAGVLTLRYNLQHARSTDEAIAAYYQGLGGVQEHGMYPDTVAYVRSVNGHMARL